MAKRNSDTPDLNKVVSNHAHGNLMQELDVDEFLQHIGPMGRTQSIILVIFCIIIIPSTYQTLVMSFVGNSPEWKCSEKNFDSFNQTFYELSCKNNTSNFTTQANFTVQKNFTMLTNSSTCIWPECYQRTYFSAKDDSRCHMKRHSWDYVKPKSYSIVTEWDLVCEKNEMSYLANSAMFIGWAFGAVFLGYISDRYGRKIVLFPSWTIILLAAFASGFASNFWLFFTARLIIGFFQGGVGLTLFVLATELVGPKYRSFAGTTIWFAFTFALCSVAIQAWLLPKWKYLEMIVSLPYIVFLLFYKMIPESVRWLRLCGRVDEAELILRDVARKNKKTVPEKLRLSNPPGANNKRATFRDLFMPCTMCLSTLVQCLAWFVNGQVYYGISLASDNLGGDMYRDFVLTSLVEIPANVLVIVCSNKYGRKSTTIASMLIGGAACIGVAFIDPVTSALQWSRVGLGMLGKLCITVSFNVLYIWSVELHPTIVRSQGMGLLSVVSRIGAATAPWVAQFMGYVHKTLPFGVMGTLTLISAGLCLLLKETGGLATAETLNDTANDKTVTEMAEIVGSNGPLVKDGAFNQDITSL